MAVTLYINLHENLKGGPLVWIRRFCAGLEKRGIQVTSDLNAGWDAALFVVRSEGLDRALESGKPVGYRVANGYLPAWFNAMGLEMKAKHHEVNSEIARALEVATVVIYQSQWSKSILDETIFLRPENFSVIHNGVDLDRFSPLKSPAPRAEEPSITLGTVGLLRYRYRLQTFFEASRRLDFPHRLLIVGSLDDQSSRVMDKYRADPIIGPRIEYHPSVEEGAMPQYYRQMDLLVHPVCGDACPNVVVEALACGVPVVAPAFGGTAEVIGEGGLVFDCLPWRYDEDFVESMAQAARQALQEKESLAPKARLQAETHLDIEGMLISYLRALGLPERSREAVSLRGRSSPTLKQRLSPALGRPRFVLAMGVRRLSQLRRKVAHPSQHAKPRIAFTLYDFHVGGIENWLFRLAGALREQFDFFFLATAVADILPKFTSVGETIFLPSPRKMMAYLQEKQIDIVQVHNQRWPVDAALAAGVPHVIERTDGTRSCARVPKHGLSLVIASSKGTIPLIRQHIPEERIRLVYNGIDMKEIESAQQERLWSSQDFVIGRASRFGRGKNLGMLIEATKRLRELKSRSEYRLLLIGGDSHMPGAEHIEEELRCQAEPLGDSVCFLGEQENPLPWVKGFDLGTCVSQPGNEGIPNSLIEAMACARPVVSTRVDQVEELVTDGESGLLIEPDDLPGLVGAISRIASQPELANRMGLAGRRVVEEKFSLEAAARRYAAIYVELLKSG